jgi:outer membrane lipoprotein-sorting protein
MLNLCGIIIYQIYTNMKKPITLLLCLTFTLTAWSQTVDGIVNKYFESIGGVEKWKTVKTARMNGTVPTPQGEFAFEMLRKAPNLYIISLEVMGQKMIPTAYDGVTAWSLIPFTGDTIPQKLSEEQAASVIQQAEFEDFFIDYAKKGEVTYEGTADVDGVKCYVLKVVRDKGTDKEAIYVYHFDSETYIPIMVKQTMKSGQMAGQELSVYYSDYQDAGDGMLMPYTIDTRMGGQSVQAIKFTKIEVNVDISDDVFKYKGI